MDNLAWYALRVQSEYENRIKENLESRIRANGINHCVDRILVPMESISEVKSGKKRIIQQRMFPGYVFIEIHTVNQKIPNDLWFVIMETDGISGFVGANRMNPEPMEHTEVQRIIDDIESKKECPKPKTQFTIGDMARIKEGSFINYDGIITSIDQTKWMLGIKISIFGRETIVELEYNKVEKV